MTVIPPAPQVCILDTHLWNPDKSNTHLMMQTEIIAKEMGKEKPNSHWLQASASLIAACTYQKPNRLLESQNVCICTSQPVPVKSLLKVWSQRKTLNNDTFWKLFISTSYLTWFTYTVALAKFVKQKKWLVWWNTGKSVTLETIVSDGVLHMDVNVCFIPLKNQGRLNCHSVHLQ